MSQRMMDDKFFNQCIVRDECSKLHSVYSAIESWEDLAVREWQASRPDTTQMSDLQADWAADHFNDQAYMMHVTKQSMLGSLAVTIASSVENFFGALCEDRNIQLGNRAGWGEKRQRLETDLGISCDDLTGIEQVTRVRLLGNCFKHNEGKVNSEFVDMCSGNEGNEIDFNIEDWETLIKSTERFLLDLISHT
ncbi:hypothetical protein [Gimesia sp.]|uniref:hypothetical protein n=1 Tax=Gimesia sp. TaxID=2024833 RepID=UPI003A932584